MVFLLQKPKQTKKKSLKRIKLQPSLGEKGEILMVNIGNERKGIIIVPTDTKKIMQAYYEQLCVNFNSLDEIHIFL